MLLYVFLYVVGIYNVDKTVQNPEQHNKVYRKSLPQKSNILSIPTTRHLKKKNLLCCVGVKSAWICFEFIYYVCIHGIQNLGDGLSYNTEGFLKHLVIRDILPTLTASLPWQG